MPVTQQTQLPELKEVTVRLSRRMIWKALTKSQLNLLPVYTVFYMRSGLCVVEHSRRGDVLFFCIWLEALSMQRRVKKKRPGVTEEKPKDTHRFYFQAISENCVSD